LIKSHYGPGLDLLEKEMNLNKKTHGYEIAVVSESTRGE
jgi:hypothetical protein